MFEINTNILGNGTIEPSGSVQVAEGESSNIKVISPDGMEVSGMDNDIPITAWTTPSNDTIIVPASYYGTATYEVVNEWGMEGAVGKLAETTTLSPTNSYSKSTNGEDVYALFTYTFDTSGVPSDAQNIRLKCVVKAKPMSLTASNERLSFYLSIWSTPISDTYDFKNSGSTSLTTQTIASDIAIAYKDLKNLKLRGEIGKSGGGVAGITLTISYELPPIYYYSIDDIHENHNIVVTIGNPLAIKSKDGWKIVKSVYKKTNDAWVEQSVANIQELFATHRYIQSFPTISWVNLTQAGRWVDSGTTKDGHIVYKSDGSYHINNAKDVARITVLGYNTLKLYIRSYAESNYDYTEAFEVNVPAVRSKGKYRTRGNQSATNYTECIYTLDPSVESFIDVMYSKDGSSSYNDDRGYFYYVVE